MFIEVAPLGEVLITTINRALVWLFTGVDSYMIKEIVPLLKGFAAAINCANEDLSPSQRARVIVFN